jgi:hypothetical protein
MYLRCRWTNIEDRCLITEPFSPYLSPPSKAYLPSQEPLRTYMELFARE